MQKKDEAALFLPTIADGEDKTSILANRLRKNYRHIRKWAKRTVTNCFRIYDDDIPQYPVAIDFYDGRFCVHYFSRKREQENPPDALIEEVVEALTKIFAVKKDNIYWRCRAKNKETRQYEKRGTTGEFFTVLEYRTKFLVNLQDYLDTGLFLDHRETRKRVADLSKGKRLLNLFSYTCSFSVHAAKAGALYTKSVDLSNTYTEWGKDNFILNELGLENNQIIREDCLKFLEKAINDREKYDLIVIDPPTISRSKKMTQLFDIQADYIFLIEKSLNLLLPNGMIFFSTNSRKFKLDTSLFPECKIMDISNKTMPIDFRDKKIHQAWQINCDL